MKIPALSSAEGNLDIGEKYMVSRHRKNILEGMGVMRHEMPSTAGEQVIMLKAYKAQDPEKYCKLFDLYVRNIQPDMNPEKMKDADIEGLKKEALAKIIEVGADVEVKIENLYERLEVELVRDLDDAIEKADSKISESVKKISDSLEKRVNEEILKARKVEHIIKVADSAEIATDAVLPLEFDKIVSLASNRVNIFITGPSGCGKTHVSAELAKVLSLPFYGQSCSAGMSESIFSGWLLPIGDSGKFSYVESPFVRAYENGGVFLFDEIDAADGNTMLFLNQALANNKFFLPQRFENPVVLKHKDFVAVAAANTFGNGADSLYNSRNALDAASMDRFRMGVVEMNYSSEVEEALVDKVILSIGREIRKSIQNNRLRKIMSTRFMLDATKMKLAGWNHFEIFSSYFKDWTKDEMKNAHHLLSAAKEIDQVNKEVQSSTDFEIDEDFEIEVGGAR